MYRIIFTLALAGVLVACGDSKQEQSAAPAQPQVINLPASSIVEATVRAVRPSFEFPAVVEAVQLARVRPEVTATLKTIHFSPGETVKKS